MAAMPDETTDETPLPSPTPRRDVAWWRRAFRGVLDPVYRWLLRRVPADFDPWQRVDKEMHLRHYGPGVQHDFPGYLEGPSSVRVRTIADIQTWLLGCTYLSDDRQFGRDHWQHASEFERRRQGDCDDFALWAWRKLVELGYDATLVAGCSVPRRRPLSRHAVVTFRDSTGEWLLEATATKRQAMLRPFAEARASFRPEYGVDRHGRRFTYAGFMISMRENEGIDPLPPETTGSTSPRGDAAMSASEPT